MERTFVPVPNAMPSRWRILQRDGLAKLTCVLCVLGLALCAIYIVEAARPRRPAHVIDIPGYRPLQIEPVHPPVGPSWLVVGACLAVLFPLRIYRVRRLFRQGREVTGRVETLGKPHRGAVRIAYTYAVDGTTYRGTYPSNLGAELAFNQSVAVVVDPKRPSRSMLKHAFILESVDAVPRARVVR